MRKKRIMLVSLFCVVLLLTACGNASKDEFVNNDVENIETESMNSESTESENVTEEDISSEIESSEIVNNSTEDKVPTEDKAPTEEKTPTEDKAPTEEKTPTEDKAPTEEKTPTEDKVPTEDKTPTEDKAPTDNNANEDVPSGGSSAEQTPQAPAEQENKTWIEEKGFKITPWSESFCVIKEAGHVCTQPTLLEIVETKDEMCEDGFKHVYMTFCNWNDACLDGYFLTAVDKYTGRYLIGGWENYNVIEYDGSTYMFASTGWEGGGEQGWEVLCSQNYDGIVFVLVSEERRIGFPNDEQSSIEDIFDLSGGDCYFFSTTNN